MSTVQDLWVRSFSSGWLVDFMLAHAGAAAPNLSDLEISKRAIDAYNICRLSI
jgi:hypothetical protein